MGLSGIMDILSAHVMEIVCGIGVVGRKKLITHKAPLRVVSSNKTGKCGRYKPDMSAIIHFWSDVAHVKLEYSELGSYIY